jgi:hypothetical protein
MTMGGRLNLLYAFIFKALLYYTVRNQMKRYHYETAACPRSIPWTCPRQVGGALVKRERKDKRNASTFTKYGNHRDDPDSRIKGEGTATKPILRIIMFVEEASVDPSGIQRNDLCECAVQRTAIRWSETSAILFEENR